MEIKDNIQNRIFNGVAKRNPMKMRKLSIDWSLQTTEDQLGKTKGNMRSQQDAKQETFEKLSACKKTIRIT